MNQYEAEDYCRSQGYRLPTARELALYSRSLGGEGISETTKTGFYPVKALDSSYQEDRFIIVVEAINGLMEISGVTFSGLRL